MASMSSDTFLRTFYQLSTAAREFIRIKLAINTMKEDHLQEEYPVSHLSQVITGNYSV